MDVSEIDMDGGMFRFTLPYDLWKWLGWGIGALFALIGIVSYFMIGPEALFASCIGFSVMALFSPGSFEAELHRIRKNAIDPAELEAKAEQSGLKIESWWLQQKTFVPTTDPSDWILPAPGPASWDESDRYGPEGDGSALPEHPSKVGTPIPATLTSFAVWAILAIIILFFGAYSFITETGDYIVAYVLIGLGVILTAVGYFRARMIRQMLDTPTSLVRSMAVGNPELVGQVRPAPEGCLTVVVDGNQNMVMHNMVSYYWAYEQYQCRTTRDSEGNSKEECHWVTIRSDEGGCPFILHDGTGGVRVNAQTFKRTDHGLYLKRWDGAFAQSLGKQFMAQAVAGILGGGRVKKHRWTLYGIRLANPVYVLGNAVPRTRESLASEGLDGVLQNSLLEVNGDEDAPGIKVTLQRGTELSNLGRSRSGFELMILPFTVAIGAIALLGVA